MERLICIVIGYLLGIIQTGYIYGKSVHVDIRKHGSGNAGTTNALRTLGWKAGVITFIGDALKTVLAVVAARLIFAGHADLTLLAMYAGVGAVLGHNYPFYMNFKGGKGIASTVGLVLCVNPWMFLTLFVVFLSIFFLTKYVSLGSLTIMVLFVIETVIVGQRGGFGLSGIPLYEFYALAVFLAAMAWWRHRENIKRLISRTENKIEFNRIKK